MKEIQRKLLFEMMSNSRRSDRELAKALKTSQPTVTRARRWLEMNGFIREYTLMPNFTKIGFELVAYTFFKIHANMTEQSPEQFKKKITAFLDKHPNVVKGVRGEGMGADGVLVSYHANFSDFANFVRELKAEPVGIEVSGSFLSSLGDEGFLKKLTFKHFKKYAEKSVKE